jgi:hypothetical protein
MKMTSFLVVAVYVLLIWADTAQAYIDPATGSMVLQAMLAALIGVGFFVRQARITVAAFIKRVFGKFSGKAGGQ